MIVFFFFSMQPVIWAHTNTFKLALKLVKERDLGPTTSLFMTNIDVEEDHYFDDAMDSVSGGNLRLLRYNGNPEELYSNVDDPVKIIILNGIERIKIVL